MVIKKNKNLTANTCDIDPKMHSNSVDFQICCETVNIAITSLCDRDNVRLRNLSWNLLTLKCGFCC